MSEQVTFPKRFRGPATSVNGGYGCGAVASLLGGGVAEVTLRAPLPLETPLSVHREDDQVALRLGDKLLAQGKRATLELDIPAAPSMEQAVEASHPHGAERPSQYERHILPECFVCGITRTVGDALCLWPGKIAGRELIATTWTPLPEVCDADGTVPTEVVWSALDCPTGWIFVFLDKVDGMTLLGRLTAQIFKPLRSGERYIQAGWPLGSESRKLFGASAIFSESGTLHAAAKGTWIKLAT